MKHECANPKFTCSAAYFALIMFGCVVVSWLAASIWVQAYADVGTMEEPAVTWNLFITPIVSAVMSGLVIMYIDRSFKRRDSADEKIAALLAEKEERVQVETREWHGDVKRCYEEMHRDIDDIKVSLRGKVDFSHCNAKEKDFAGELEKLEKRLYQYFKTIHMKE